MSQTTTLGEMFINNTTVFTNNVQYTTSSSSVIIIDTNPKTFIIATGLAISTGYGVNFIAIPTNAAMSSAGMTGTVISYDSDIGELICSITSTTGFGTFNNWIVNYYNLVTVTQIINAGWISGSSNHFTNDTVNGRLICNSPNITSYYVSATIAGKVNNNLADVLAIYKNDLRQDNLTPIVEISQSNISITGILTLANNDYIDIRCILDWNTSIFIDSITFSAIAIQSFDDATGPGASGVSGFSGKSGFSGESGFSGFSGDTGFSGFSGTSGYSGRSGTSGRSGYSGVNGESGYSGIDGESGYSGRSGYSGVSGYSGLGFSGKSGYSGQGFSGYSGNGLSGYSGQQGSPGVGTSGYSGDLGEQGSSGYSGQAFIGSSGYSGIPGAFAASGYSGSSGYSGNSGYSGESGYSGTSGYSGYSGSGYSGTSGYSGSSGISGYSGTSGYSGRSGTSGYSGSSGTSGYSGLSGYSGISGYSGKSGYSGNSGYSGLSTNINVLNFGAVSLQLRSIYTYGGTATFDNNTTIRQSGKFVDVVNGDYLWIHNNKNSIGVYLIQSHTNDTATISGTFSDSSFSNIFWKVTTAASTVDNWTAFQNAINAADALGGGVVEIPSGYFYFTNTTTLAIKKNVILRGTRSSQAFFRKDYWFAGQIQGPVLLPTSTGSASFITLQGTQGTSVVQGFTVFYPFQHLIGSGTSLSVVTYPWCIEFAPGVPEQDAQFCDNLAKDLVLVNPYNGIKAEGAPYTSIGRPTARNFINNIYGMPLNVGVYLNNLEDVCYIERINFSIYNLLAYDPEAVAIGQLWTDWATWSVLHLVAVELKRGDWIILKDIFALFAHRGLLLDDDTVTGGAVFMGENIQFDLCDVGIHITMTHNAASYIEPILKNVRITTGSPWVTSPVTTYATKHCIYADATSSLGGSSTMIINNSSLLNYLGGDIIRWDINGQLQVTNTLFLENNQAGTSFGHGVTATMGSMFISNSIFGGGQFLSCFNITGTENVIFANNYNTNDPGINDIASTNSMTIKSAVDNVETNFKTSRTYSQLTLNDSDTSTAGLKLGYMFNAGVAEYGRIQAYDSVGPTPLMINPNGGYVGINTGAIMPQGTFQINNSYIVAAAPTGNADMDTNNIKAAIAAVTRDSVVGGTVYLQSGLYSINSTLDLHFGSSLIGCGAGTTVLYVNSATPITVIRIYQVSATVIKKIRIDSVQDRIHTAISSKKSFYTNVEDCQIWNMDIGIWVTYCINTFSHLNIQWCNTGVLLGDSTDSTDGWCSANVFIGGDYTYNKKYGVHLAYQAFNNRFFGVTIEANWGPDMIAGIYFGDTDGGNKANVLDGCYFENNDESQIKIATKGNIFTGNTILYPSAPMISPAVPASTGLTVDGGSPYTGTFSCPVSVKCDSSTTFVWSNDGEKTWSASVTITGTSQLLFSGVRIIFSSTTGHSTSEKWTFWAYYTEQGISFDDINSTGEGNSFYGNYEASTTGGVVYRDFQLRTVSIGSTSIDPAAKLQVTGGDIKIATSAKGVILTNAAGTVTKRVRLNDTGNGLIFENV